MRNQVLRKYVHVSGADGVGSWHAAAIKKNKRSLRAHAAQVQQVLAIRTALRAGRRIAASDAAAKGRQLHHSVGDIVRGHRLKLLGSCRSDRRSGNERARDSAAGHNNFVGALVLRRCLRERVNGRA